MIPKVDALNPQVWNGTGAVWLWPNSIVWWHQSKRCQVSICYHVASIYIHMIYDFFIVRTSYMIYWYILHVTLLKWYIAMLVSHQIYVRLMLCKCTCLKAMSIHGRLTSELQVKLVQGWFYIDVGVGHLDWLFVAYACGNIENIRKDIVSAWSESYHLQIVWPQHGSSVRSRILMQLPRLFRCFGQVVGEFEKT